MDACPAVEVETIELLPAGELVDIIDAALEVGEGEFIVAGEGLVFVESGIEIVTVTPAPAQIPSKTVMTSSRQVNQNI